MKLVTEKFSEATAELFALAGDDEILKKKLKTWVNTNFRMHEVKEVITTAERLRARMDILVPHKTQAIMGRMCQSLVGVNDIELTSKEDEHKQYEITARAITFTNAPEKEEKKNDD